MSKATRSVGVTSDIGAFAIVPEWLLTLGISANAIRIFATLALYADRNTGKAHPSRAALAKRCQVSRSTVDRGLEELEQAGAIEIHERYEDDGDEGARRQTSNGYRISYANPEHRSVVTPPIPESDEGAIPESDEAPLPRSDDPGTRTTLNQNQPEPENTLPAAPEYDPVKGIRVDGRDLPWDALEEATLAYGAANGPRMKMALKTIRPVVWEYVQQHWPDAAARTQHDPAGYERAVADSITSVARWLMQQSPGGRLTWGPEGVARNFARALTEMRASKDIASIVEDEQRRAS